MGSKIFLGKYRVSAEKIGAVGEPGDSPLVYEGEEIDSGRKVVVEAIPAASLKMEVRQQLEANAIDAKKLNHVNIHALRDFGVEDDHLVYITEDLKGTLLEEWVNTHGPMPPGPVLRIASQVVSALGAAGLHQVVHRAINPSNLMLVPGETAEGEWPMVKVLHFEGVKPNSFGPDGTVPAFDKSLHFASPEQLRYGVVDFRAEIYSLGSTMWFLLTGLPPPMTAEGPMAVPTTKAEPAADQVNAIPEKIHRLLAQMLSVNPNARPGDPRAFSLQLQECVAGTGSGGTRSRTLRAPVESPRRLAGMPAHLRIPMKTIAVAAVVLAIMVSASLFLVGYLRRHTAEPTGVRIGVPNASASPTPAPAAGPVVMLAPEKSGPHQQPAASSAVNVTLVGFTPMAGTPGGKDFKIATLTFRIEASSPVTVTESSFYVESAPFNDGPRHKPPITLFIHSGTFLGPPGTTLDPAHPMERTIWLTSQENVFPNWLLAYNQTENATFRWVISGQPWGGLVVKPLHKAWPSLRSPPEVRRAEPIEE